jgi:hypothetical protein
MAIVGDDFGDSVEPLVRQVTRELSSCKAGRSASGRDLNDPVQLVVREVSKELSFGEAAQDPSDDLGVNVGPLLVLNRRGVEGRGRGSTAKQRGQKDGRRVDLHAVGVRRLGAGGKQETKKKKRMNLLLSMMSQTSQ